MVNVITNKFSSIVVAGKDGKEIRVDEGNKVRFVTDSGVEVVGAVTKIAGSAKERKLQVLPVMSECEQLWSLMVIAEGSLEVVGGEESEEEPDEE